MANSISGLNGVDALNGSRQDQKDKKSKSLGEDAFLELMITQIKNQSPTNPADSGQFLSQLAEFSTVSGINDMQKSFASLATAMQSNQALQASTMVGRQVEIENSKLKLGATDKPSFGFELAAPAGGVSISIADATGQTVRTLKLGQTAAGSHDVTWDGLNAKGERLPAGTYTLKAEATIEGKTQAITTLVRAPVESVSLPRNGQQPTINIADYGSVNLDAIRRVL